MDGLKQYEVSVTRFFWAEDADHAIEQFAGETSEEVAEWVNVCEEIG